MAQRKAREKVAPSDSVDSLAAPGALESGAKIENWALKKDSVTYEAALKLYQPVKTAYDNQTDRVDANSEYWSIFNAKPDANQQYSGNSQCYVPAVRDCVNARTKRRLKQLFPTRHRHVEAVGSDPEIPYPQLALLEHYVRTTRLKDTVRADMIAGDVTGQWNLYIDWTKSYRRITEVIRGNPIMESVEGEEVGLVDPTEEDERTEETDILEEGPEICCVADEDVAVIPPVCEDVEKAEAVSVRMRMSREKVLRLCDEGVFVTNDDQTPEELWNQLEQASGVTGQQKKPPDKQRANDAGVKTDGTFKYLEAYEVTAKLPYDDGNGGLVNRLSYIYFTSQNDIRGIFPAPQWGGKRPLLSASASKISGSFKGISRIEPVKFLQWNLNDYWNMGQDSAMYSLLPIVMTDPLKNPNYASMVYGLAAVWAADPNSTKLANFPQLYKDSAQVCEIIKSQIWESMDVNEMMMGRMPAGRKNNAMFAGFQQDQMVNIMDDAERYEEVMLNPLVERLMEYDRQFRTTSLTVVTMGEIGVKAKVTEIEPQQFGQRYRFQWAGTTIVQGQQLQQMRIAGMNVLRGVPPQQLNGRRLDVTPILEKFVEDLYGADLAPRILVDERNMFTVPPEMENEMMFNNLPAQIHEADDDQQHLQSHMSAARLTGDMAGRYRAHIAAHTMQMQAKMQRAMGVQMGPGGGGMPGAPVAGQGGLAGTPRVGAVPGGPNGPSGPPGLPSADAGPMPGRG